MTFDTNAYLDWYMEHMRRPDTINLHSSGVSALNPADLEFPKGNLWMMARELEETLGTWQGIPGDQVCFTPGATGGTLLALLTLASPGDDILVEAPVYEPMRHQAERLNPTQRFHRRPADGWRIPLEAIEGKITAKTKLIMMTEPGNPGGLFAPREEVIELARLAARHGATLLINEVYRGFTDKESYHGQGDNIVIVSSLSKLIGAYVYRLGWLSASKETIQRLHAAHRNMGMPTQPAAGFGLSIMAEIDARQEAARRLAREGQGRVDAWVRKRPDIRWQKPEMAGFGCIELLQKEWDDIDFATFCHDNYHVMTVPGAFFEVPHSLRISWLQAGDRLQEGLEKLGQALEQYRPAR